MARAGRSWWERRDYAIALVLLSAVPLIWPVIPPLTDLPGHMGRYRIQLDLASSPFLHQWYSFKWGLLGNLGVDLLIEPFGRLLGIEAAVKGIVIATVMMTVAGLLWIAREVHGRLPPTAAFALPLAYGFAFQFGFVNFVLSMALALLAFGLWLQMARRGAIRLRAALFVPIGMIIWLAHSFGWGVLGLLAFPAEVARNRRRGPIGALACGAIGCLPLLPPMVLMVLWRSESVAGQTADWFNWSAKSFWMMAILREHWLQFDLMSALVLLLVFMVGLVKFGIDRWLGAAAVLLLATFVLLPRILLGSAYADMRLASYMVAIAIVAIGTTRASPRLQQAAAIAGLAFFLMRTTATTIDFLGKDRTIRQQLAAIDHIPRGARVFALVDLPCEGRWEPAKIDHIASLAIVRREAFANGQWEMPGAQLLRVTYDRRVGRYASDPSQVLRPDGCRPRLLQTYEQSLAGFPRDAFDYLWLIDMPQARWPKNDPGLRIVWSRPDGVLYRIGSATSPSDTPNGSERRATQ